MSEESLKLAQSISHDIWEKYDDTYGYRTEKQAYNARPELTQHPDNIWFFWGQFDRHNQAEFVDRAQMSARAGQPGGSELTKWAKTQYNVVLEATAKLEERGIFL